MYRICFVHVLIGVHLGCFHLVLLSSFIGEYLTHSKLRMFKVHSLVSYATPAL